MTVVSDATSLGFPRPLWLAANDQSDGALLPGGCEAATGHRTWLLLICQSGGIPLLLDGETMELLPGRALLLPYPESALNLRRDAGPWQCLALGFIGFNDLVDKLRQHGDLLDLPAEGWVGRQLQALCDEERPDFTLSSGMRLVFDILLNLIEHNHQVQRDDVQSHLVRRAIAILDGLVEQDRSLREVASQLGISPAHLSRLFRQQLQTSPRRYLMQRRMRRACEWLRAGEGSVAAIAGRLGYDSTSAFTKAFRLTTGMSPTEYRNSHSVPVWAST